MLARRMESNPFDLLDREFNRMLGRFWGAGNAEVPATLAPYAVDVHEDADHFYVNAELPGFTKDDVDITLEDGVLTIHAERKDETTTPPANSKEKQPLHIERRWTRFERSFTLPAAVNEGAVQAALSEGVLTITLDKREEVKPRKIQINAKRRRCRNQSREEGVTLRNASALLLKVMRRPSAVCRWPLVVWPRIAIGYFPHNPRLEFIDWGLRLRPVRWIVPVGHYPHRFHRDHSLMHHRIEVWQQLFHIRLHIHQFDHNRQVRR